MDPSRMLTRVYDEIYFGTWQAFRTIVPELQDRTPLTWKTAPYPVACYIPFVFLAYLARRPDTYLIRLLLLPSVLTCILTAAYRFVWTPPELNVYNWGQCLLAATMISKSLEYAFHKEGMLKIGEVRPGVLKEKNAANGHTGPQEPNRLRSLIGSGLYDAFELINTLRGLQWQFGQGVHIPKHTRPLQRGPFLRATLKSFIINYTLLDFVESLIKLFPGVGTPSGGSMFYWELPPLARYAVSTIVHSLTGLSLLYGFGMVYDLFTLIAVALCDSSPTSWPPIMDRPWHSDSMHSFWSIHWHQVIRQTFLVLGGYPGARIAGNLGLLFGTFIASGLFHECAMYSMGKGFDHTVAAFFVLQGFILLLERGWRRITGLRVHGVWGRIWVYFVIFILAQPLVDAWHRRGLGGGMVIPPLLSPTRFIFVPLAQYLLQR